MEAYRTYLDPRTLAKIKDLELQARQIIEGLVSGAHKSPYQGLSVEFAEHREYVAGDDVRHIDWKVFGKTDKYYLKQYEQETNLVCNLILDCSQSMRYGSGEITKQTYAARLAASLAYLVLHQQDSVGMALFEDQVRQLVPPSSQPSRLRHLLQLIATSESAPVPSRIGSVLDELADRLRKRSLAIVISDCFDDVESILAGLRHLRYKRHEVVLFHVLDGAEIDFRFQDAILFKGLESMPELLAEPRALRTAYQESFGRFLKELMIGCRATNVEYRLFRTDQPLDLALAGFLNARKMKAS